MQHFQLKGGHCPRSCQTCIIGKSIRSANNKSKAKVLNLWSSWTDDKFLASFSKFADLWGILMVGEIITVTLHHLWNWYFGARRSLKILVKSYAMQAIQIAAFWKTVKAPDNKLEVKSLTACALSQHHSLTLPDGTDFSHPDLKLQGSHPACYSSNWNPWEYLLIDLERHLLLQDKHLPFWSLKKWSLTSACSTDQYCNKQECHVIGLGEILAEKEL